MSYRKPSAPAEPEAPWAPGTQRRIDDLKPNPLNPRGAVTDEDVQEGRQVYDFRNPTEENVGFNWRSIDPNWQSWTPQQYRDALQHPLAEHGYKLDSNAMGWCDTCVLVLPSGRSASFELGWCLGAGKRGIVYIPEPCEPELMYREAEIVCSEGELAEALGVRPAARQEALA